MSNHKTIKINPELFSLTKQKKTKPDATKAKTKKNTTFNPKNLKNKLCFLWSNVFKRKIFNLPLSLTLTVRNVFWEGNGVITLTE